jgi:hypothetical protein
MAFPRTLAVFLLVILASLAFVAQDALAARDLVQANGMHQQLSHSSVRPWRNSQFRLEIGRTI